LDDEVEIELFKTETGSLELSSELAVDSYLYDRKENPKATHQTDIYPGEDLAQHLSFLWGRIEEKSVFAIRFGD
jgi:hypothetical protein